MQPIEKNHIRVIFNQADKYEVRRAGRFIDIVLSLMAGVVAIALFTAYYIATK